MRYKLYKVTIGNDLNPKVKKYKVIAALPEQAIQTALNIASKESTFPEQSKLAACSISIMENKQVN